MNLILVPATRENLEQSVEKSVNITFAKTYLTSSFVDNILKYSGIEGLRCWAMTENRKYIWDTLYNGDEVLLSEKRTGKFTHYGVVIGKVDNLEFGNALWPIVGKEPWRYIYFLANIKKINIDKSSFVQKIGYSSNYTVPGVVKVSDSEYNKLGTISNHFKIPVFNNVAETNEVTEYYAPNIQITGTRRIGHQKFSKEIKQNYKYKCAICGVSEAEFLVAGHISSWSEDEQNRLNPQNGICLCSIHDKAFEHGYIGLDNNYQIILNSNIDNTSILYTKYLGEFKGKQINLPNLNKPDKNLLNAHRKKHKIGEYGNQRT